MAYTLDDLKEAENVLRRAQERADNYRRNNPDFGQADIRAAQDRLETITLHLKASGALPLTDEEKLEDELDAAFPDAKSRDTVEHNGKRYQLRFYPARKSRSGKTVTQWDRWWEEVDASVQS